MVDKIKIRLSGVMIAEEFLGDSYNSSVSRMGNVLTKYRLYFLDEPLENSCHLEVIVNRLQNCVTISGSLRKWYFGKNNISDLTRKRFAECLKRLREKLRITEEELNYALVTQLEIGANLKLPPLYKQILSCISHYPKLKRLNVETETVEFQGENFDIIMYDKLEEVFKKKKKRVLKKLNRYMYILRYEIQVTKVSGHPIRSKANTLGKIYYNWDELLDYWEKESKKIVFVDNLSPEIIHPPKEMVKSEVIKALVYEGMKAVGEPALRSMLLNNVQKKRTSEIRKFLNEIWESNRSTVFREYKDVLLSAISEKAKRLKTSSSRSFNNISKTYPGKGKGETSRLKGRT